jgi:hypothetical protein
VLILGKNEGEHGCGWGKVLRIKPDHTKKAMNLQSLALQYRMLDLAD